MLASCPLRAWTGDNRMEIPKYSKLENERRFLVAEGPDLTDAPSRLIEDIYLSDTRLRVRAITHPDGARELKLCKKYRPAAPESGPSVNIYLSPKEHAVMAELPGRPLRKRRFSVVWRGVYFGLDVFEGDLSGLMLCEAEAETLDAVRSIEFPQWAGPEVTDNPFFTGGNLVRVTVEELRV